MKMAEYICKETIIDDIEKEIETGDIALDENLWINKGLGIAIRVIKDIKAADVQPIRHGRWTDNVYKYVKPLDAYFIQAKCSVCGRYSDSIDIYSRYMSNECCSRCGARMDGDTE